MREEERFLSQEELRARTAPQDFQQMGHLQGQAAFPRAVQEMAMREQTVRELLESRLRGAVQEAADIRVVLAMLPTEPSPQQDAALRRLLTGGRK